MMKGLLLRTADPPWSFLEKIVEVAALLFGGAADLALAFAGAEAGGLEPEALDFFGGGDVDIVIDRLRILETVIEKGRDFDAPAFALCFYLVFVADADVFGGFGGEAVVFDLAFVAGIGGFRAGLEQTDRPKIFIETELFLFGHGAKLVNWRDGGRRLADLGTFVVVVAEWRVPHRGSIDEWRHSIHWRTNGEGRSRKVGER